MLGTPAFSNILLVFFGLPVLYQLTKAFYNIYFHPLRKYPGPKTWAASRIPWNWVNLKGRLAWRIRELHEIYGPVIRIAPDELSYTTSTAWTKIYGQKHPEFMKALDGRGIAPASVDGQRGLVTEEQERHARLRRAIVPAFSDRALREQEVWLQTYSDKLVTQLRSKCTTGPQNMTRWYSLTVFDIISGLAFGESSSALEDADHPWLNIMGARASAIAYYQLAVQYGVFDWLMYFAPRRAVESRRIHRDMVRAKMKRRLALKGDPKDFMSYILNNKTETLNNVELLIMASSFVVAGGTTSSALSAATFFLLRNPETMSRLVEEVRNAFSNKDQITMASTTELPYLRAVIDETLRLYAPSPCALPRVVPGKGEMIDGAWVPGGTAVGVHQLSASHSERNFHKAKTFNPQRFMELQSQQSPYAKDDKASVQPFSFGPRNCIGKSLAYAQMRLILCKILLSFDLELVDNTDDWWNKQKTFIVWEKLPLMVKLRPRT